MGNGLLAKRIGAIVVAASAVFLAAKPTNAAEPASPDANRAYQLAMDAGRIETIVARAEETADRVLRDQMPKDPATLREYDAATLRMLKIAILRYNILAEAACDADRPNQEFCGAPYIPSWLGAPVSTVYSRDQMQAMIREAETKLTPYWNAVCARGKTVTGDARYCELQ